MTSIQQNWKFFLYEGIVLIIFGLLALLLPTVITYGIEILFGALVLIAGILQTFRLTFAEGMPGFIATLLSSILFILLGVLLLVFPGLGILTLTFLLSLLFFADGCLKAILSFQVSTLKGWFWYLLSGVIEIVLAILIWNQWPTSAYWFIGILVGVNFLFAGFAHVMIANEGRKHSPKF